MIRIALLRHFPTDWNAEGRLQGKTDRPLTDAARAELAGLALPPPWDAADVICSPLARARETAASLAGGRPVASEPALREIGFGDWEGRLIRDLLGDPGCAYVPMTEWGWTRRPPGGESPEDAWRRIRPALAAIRHPSVVVAHKGTMRAILARAWGWNYDGPEPFEIRKGRLYPLTIGAGGLPMRPEPPIRLVRR